MPTGYGYMSSEFQHGKLELVDHFVQSLTLQVKFLCAELFLMDDEARGTESAVFEQFSNLSYLRGAIGNAAKNVSYGGRSAGPGSKFVQRSKSHQLH
jgi:hypothetical protein